MITIRRMIEPFTAIYLAICVDGIAAPEVCDPEPMFDGSDICFVPDDACCDIDADLSRRCSDATAGALTDPGLCPPSWAPPAYGVNTDYRTCVNVWLTYQCGDKTRWLICCD